MRIRAVTLDFWGTLYDGVSAETGERPRRRAELVTSLLEPYMTSPGAAAPERLAGLLYRASRLRNNKEGFRAFRVAERLGWVARELGLRVPAAALARMAEEVSALGARTPPQPFGTARAVVEDLSRDFALGLVSDTGLTGGAALREVMRADGLAPPVRAFGFSDESGVSKPHADAFLPVLRELGVRPEEAVHVGDTLATDVAGACALGMRAVWIGESGPEGPPEGCAAAVVRRLAEVPAAVRGMTRPDPLR